MRLASAITPPRTGASRSGQGPGCSSSSGCMGWSATTLCTASGGISSPWMGRSPRLPWEGKKTGPSPVDRGKSGAKRSVLTEAGGLAVGVVAAGANRNDFKLARETLESIPVERPAPTPEAPQGMCLDKDYDKREVHALLEEFGFSAHICARGEEAQAIKRKAGYKARRSRGRAKALLDEPLARHSHPLEQESRQLPRPAPPYPRRHHLAKNLLLR